jgi:hypothetical protein
MLIFPKGEMIMNLVKYILSRQYRNKYDEEFTQEIIDKDTYAKKEYERIYGDVKQDNEKKL